MNEQTQNIATPATPEPPIPQLQMQYQQPQMHFQQPMQFQQTMFINQQGTGKGLAITTLIFGILAFIFQTVNYFTVVFIINNFGYHTYQWYNITTGILHATFLTLILTFGLLALRKPEGRGMAAAGLALPICASVIFCVISAICNLINVIKMQ